VELLATEALNHITVMFCWKTIMLNRHILRGLANWVAQNPPVKIYRFPVVWPRNSRNGATQIFYKKILSLNTAADESPTRTP